MSHSRSELNIPNIHFILVIVTFSEFRVVILLFVAASALSVVVVVVVVAEFELPRTQIRHRLHAGLLLSPLRKTSSYVKSQLIHRKVYLLLFFFSVFFLLKIG